MMYNHTVPAAIGIKSNALRRSQSEECRIVGIVEEVLEEKKALLWKLRDAILEAISFAEVSDYASAIRELHICASSYAASDGRLPYIFELEDAATLSTIIERYNFLQNAFDDLVVRLIDEVQDDQNEIPLYLHYANGFWRLVPFSPKLTRALAMTKSNEIFPALITSVWHKDDADRLSPATRHTKASYEVSPSLLDLRLAPSHGSIHFALFADQANTSPPVTNNSASFFDGVYQMDISTSTCTGYTCRRQYRPVYRKIRALTKPERDNLFERTQTLHQNQAHDKKRSSHKVKSDSVQKARPAKSSNHHSRNFFLDPSLLLHLIKHTAHSSQNRHQLPPPSSTTSIPAPEAHVYTQQQQQQYSSDVQNCLSTDCASTLLTTCCE